MPKRRLIAQFLYSNFVGALKATDKLIYFALCTHEQTSCLGIVDLKPKHLAYETSTSLRVVNRVIANLVAMQKIVVDGDRCLLVEYIGMDKGYETMLEDRSGKKETLLCYYKACDSSLFQKALQQRYPLLFSEKALATYKIPLPRVDISVQEYPIAASFREAYPLRSMQGTEDLAEGIAHGAFSQKRTMASTSDESVIQSENKSTTLMPERQPKP